MNKKVLSFLLIFALGLFLTGCKSASLTLNDTDVTLTVGQTYEVKPVIENAKNDLLTFSIGDQTIVSVTNNVITALKAGKTTVEVALKDYPECSGIINITVEEIPTITITGADTIYERETTELTAHLVALDEEVIWESSDNNIARVVNGKVTALKSGTVTITAICGDYEATHEIVVKGLPSLKIKEVDTLYVGDAIDLTVEEKNLEESITWTSSDDTIASVVNGKVTALKAGTVTINAKSGKAEASVEITIMNKTITISGDSTIKEDTTSQISISLTGISEIEIITWTSSDDSIVTVDGNGLMTGIKAGKATITAEWQGIKATLDVEVLPADEKLIYYYEGGASEDMYIKDADTQTITANGSGDVDFWTKYASTIFLYQLSVKVTNATFSDRISIGKNQYTGYWEILDICTSGAATWPAGTEYVLVISNSYSSFSTEHAKVQKMAIGDYVFFEKDPSTISSTNQSKIWFTKTNVSSEKQEILKQNYDGELIQPKRLGFEFLGWFDENDNKVESLTQDQIVGNYVLKAKWKELNPVTDLKINNVPNEMVTEDTFQIEASVVPTDAFFQEVLFLTSNSDIISVTETGFLTAKNAGKATITVKDFMEKVVKTYEITVHSIPSVDVKFAEDYNGVLNIGETLQLEPSYLGKAIDDLSFTFESSDSNVATVDNTGLVKAIGNGDVKITIKSSNDKKLEIGITVSGLEAKDKIDEVINLIVANNLSIVEVGNACLYNDSRNRYYTATYGSVNRFLFEDLVIDSKYREAGINGYRGGERDSMGIQFVTVHDTATLTNNSEAIANNMTKPNANASIHYVVGNGQIWECVPEKYVAYHAGDGTGTQFQWLPTGVSGTAGVQPEFDLVKEGNTYYFTINGQKTKVVCPTSNGNRSIDNPSKEHFSHLGPTWTVINGEYHIGTPWASFGQVAAGVISSKGGNNNSVGIEMCVNTSGDIYDTLQRNAKLVADILVRNNLDLTRVKQHNTFDGKNCPQVLIAGNYWNEFMEMVQINYTLRKDYSDVKVTMKSDNPSIVADNGRVVNAPSVATTVGYTVTVTSGSTSKTIKLYSVVPGTTSWEKWQGTYSASILWNNGNFVINK